MFLLVLFVFLSESDGNEYSFKENLTPYETFLSGSYWTYPVRKNNLLHGPGYFRELRFKRESVLSPEGSSDHEFPREIPTKPEYRNKGQWAKGKIPNRETELGYVPLQIYSQVRKYDTVKHLPRSDALKEASTAEEIVAAPRLREVLRQKKIQQVYEEEGYEDNGYDHGFYDHHGAKYEDKEKNEHISMPKHVDPLVKSAEEIGASVNLDSQSTPPKSPLVGYFKNLRSESNEERTRWGDGREEAYLLKETPQKVSGKHSLINREKVLTGSDTEKYDDEKMESKEEVNSGSHSRERSDERKSLEMTNVAAPRSGVVDEAEVRVINDPRTKGNPIVFPGRYTRRQYGLGRPINNWTPMAPADVYIQGSIGYQLKRPFFPGDALTHHYVPYVPFPNFYSDNPSSYASPVPHVIRLAVKTTRSPLKNAKRGEPPHGAGTLTAYASLVSNNQSTTSEIHPNKTGYLQPRSNNTIDLSLTKTRNPGRERKYNNFTRGNKTMIDPTRQPTWNINKTLLHTRHPSLPRDSKEKYVDHQSAHASALVAPKPDHKAKPGDWPVKYIEQLTIAHYSSEKNNPVMPIQNNTERLIELTKMLNAKVNSPRVKREATVHYDEQKYPFYHGISSGSTGNKDSALKYATNPDLIPKKTPGGMEFYESRDRLVRCKDPSPPEDVIPERKEDGEWNKNVQVETPRLKGLGESIECMKNKYFGKEPLDNPFFQEGVEPMTLHSTKKMETASLRKLRNGDNSRRQTTVMNQENTTKQYYSNPAYNDYSNHKMNHDNSTFVFPYNNHRLETESSPSVHDPKIVTPYPYYIDNSNNKNYYSVHENSQENSQVDVSKPRYRPPHHFMYTPVYIQKKYKPQPVSIYSIISHKGNPMHYRPLLYAHSVKTHRIVPMYPYLTTTLSPDNIASDTQTKPVKWYIIRPGEYTENKDLAEEKKETPSIWSYMNPLTPLKWWFPSLFDNRRKEPRYRRRRDVDYEYDLTNDKQKPSTSTVININNPLISDASNEGYFNIPSNHKPESTTMSTLSMDEVKLKPNVTDNIKSHLSRLSGGYISRSSNSTVEPLNPNSNLPIPTAPTTRSLEAPTGTTKLLFPRTKIPQRKYLKHKTASMRDKKTVGTTTTTKAPTTLVTRMYKPKKIVNPKLLPRAPVDTFSVLKTQSSKSESPFDSSEIGRNPRELQQVEHRRVTKEETYKTTYTPQDEARENREGERSEEEIKYSEIISDSNPLSDKPTIGTLTYLVNPSTGLGSWAEQPKRRVWNRKKKTAKTNGETGSIYSYPSVGKKSENMSIAEAHPTPKKYTRKQKETQFEKEAYIVSLMSRAPLPVQRHPKRQKHPIMGQQGLETAEARSIDDLPKESENYPSPLRTTSQFIRDPDKRKYYYVND